MQPRGFAVRGLLKPLIFWPWRVCRPPACRLILGGVSVGLTVLFLWLGGPLFLIYIPPSGTIHKKTICKASTHSFPMDWCHSVAVTQQPSNQ